MADGRGVGGSPGADPGLTVGGCCKDYTARANAIISRSVLLFNESDDELVDAMVVASRAKVARRQVASKCGSLRC